MSGIITLTTDFGLRDGYAGTMKGVMLSINEAARLVDVTHGIDPHDVRAASFAVDASYAYFPEGTVHLVVVDPGVGSSRKALAVSAAGHFFVAPDNGVLSSVLRSCGDFSAREIKNPAFMLPEISTTFHGRDVFSPAAAHLSLGTPLRDMGPPVGNPVILPPGRCSVDGNEIRGEVVYTDRFGNLVTSIPADAVGNRARAVVSVGERSIAGISESYSSVKAGEMVAVAGSSGYVEISVNRGRASDVFAGAAPQVVIRLADG